MNALELLSGNQIIFSSRGVDVSFDAYLKMVKITWKGFTDAHTYRRAMETALEKAITTRARFWFTDARQMEVVPNSEIEWTIQNWQPRWLDSPVEKAILLEPVKVFGKVSMQKMLTRDVIRKKDMKFFLDEEKAIEHIKSVKSTVDKSFYHFLPDYHPLNQ